MQEHIDQFVLVSKAQRASGASPLVLVHGSWGSSAMWAAYAQVFNALGRDVYAPDLRGHGKSGGDVAGALMGDYVADIRRAVEAHGLARSVVVGHSMGALAALMYAARWGAEAVVAIDPSPSKEVQGAGEKKEFPARYSPMDAGMPADPQAVMAALPDMPQEALMGLQAMLGMESGAARTERKAGISVPKDALPMPVLFVGGAQGESVPFGIGIKTARAMAAYYGAEALEIPGATHPGVLMGAHAQEAARAIGEWLSTRHV